MAPHPHPQCIPCHKPPQRYGSFAPAECAGTFQRLSQPGIEQIYFLPCECPNVMLCVVYFFITSFACQESVCVSVSLCRACHAGASVPSVQVVVRASHRAKRFARPRKGYSICIALRARCVGGSSSQGTSSTCWTMRASSANTITQEQPTEVRHLPRAVNVHESWAETRFLQSYERM